MTIVPTWWHWLILGMVLIVAEMFIASFTLFWFGLAALLMAAVVALWPDFGLSMQLISWTIGSIIFTLLWFRYFKPTMIDRTTAGVSREAVMGETGIVVTPPLEEKRGIVRFAMPLLGADEWEFICADDLRAGDRVEVTDVSGNTLIVRYKK